MTKKTLYLFVITTMAWGNMVAAPVSQTTAHRVAETWLQAMGMRNVKALVNVTSETPFTEFYVFAAPAGGFILISGDDCTTPVLGYSVNEHFETKDMPPHVLSFLSGYEEEKMGQGTQVAGCRHNSTTMEAAGQRPDAQGGLRQQCAAAADHLLGPGTLLQ